jgi:hypothetical protein
LVTSVVQETASPETKPRGICTVLQEAVVLLGLNDQGALKFQVRGCLILLHPVSRRIADLLYRQLADTLTIGVKRME